MSYISQTKEFIAQAKSLIDSGAIEIPELLKNIL